MKNFFAALIGLVFFTSTANCDELVFRFNNPSFGGHPMNGSYLLSSASAQNKFKEIEESLEERFSDALERRLISAVAKLVTDRIYGDAETQNDFEIGGMEVRLEDLTDTMRVSILGKDGETTIDIPY